MFLIYRIQEEEEEVLASTLRGAKSMREAIEMFIDKKKIAKVDFTPPIHKNFDAQRITFYDPRTKTKYEAVEVCPVIKK